MVIATPPGATIKEQLEDRKIDIKDFAIEMEMSEESINKLINGEIKITPKISNKLERSLGIPAKFWDNFEAIYRENIARNEAEKLSKHLGIDPKN